MKRKSLATVGSMIAIVLTLTACGNTANTGTTVTESESVAESVISTEPATESVEPESESTESESVALDTNTAAPTSEIMTVQAAEPVTNYTYTDAAAVMYAKSSVNIRSLPDTTGTKLGALAKNQSVNVTGACVETGWYRIDFNGNAAYVSNKYLTDQTAAAAQPAAVPTPAPAPAQTASANAGPSDQEMADLLAWMQAGHGSSEILLNDPGITTLQTGATYDRTAAEQIFASINSERTAAGLSALTWSEDLYTIACTRCDENDVHASVRPGTGENYYHGSGSDTASIIHNGFYNSQGHHDNYMSSSYSSIAVAVKYNYTISSSGEYTNVNNVICYEVFK